jgi:hypothetical protein
MTWAVSFVVLLNACGGESSSSGDADAQPARWTLSTQPTMQIGVVTGESSQQLSQVMGAVRLGDGRIVVLDGDSRELRFYSPEGTHLHSVGGQGQGPGEFRMPTRMSRLAGDTLRVYDFGTERLSLFDPQGAFIRAEPAPRSPDSDTLVSDPFRMEEWIYGWNWIDSPLLPEDRGGVVAALANMPAPDTTGPLRAVRVTTDGLIWTASPPPPSPNPTDWRIHVPTGEALATLTMPAGFRPFDIGRDYVLGVQRDALDVEFVRLHSLDRGADAEVAPGISALRGGGPVTYPSVPEEIEREIRRSLRNMASSQEMYYSRHYSYTSIIDSLRLPSGALPPDIRAVITHADERGWMGVFLHRPTGGSCMIAMGLTPAGWPQGSVTCPGG